jgi:aspartyl protease family protein
VPPARRASWHFWLITVAAALLGYWLLADEGAPRDPAAQARLVQLVAILAVLMLWLSRSRLGLSVLAKQVAAWALILLTILALYAYRGELSQIADRLAAQLLPGRGERLDSETIAFTRADDGHFWIDATADGTRLRFLLDTGASEIVLTKADARRLGFDPDRLRFDMPFSTANGTTRGAPIEIARLAIGPIALTHVRAWVNEGEMRQSLLGMPFLAKLTRLEISGDRLILHR